MLELPIGMHSFQEIRTENFLYVDKTEKILKLIKKGRRYFLSRPRRFGKSLTISTIEAMFKGKSEYFKGLAAEEWVSNLRERPFPVIRIDMGEVDGDEFYSINEDINNILKDIAEDYNIDIEIEKKPRRTFKNLIRAMKNEKLKVVLLIDEYDKPILNNIGNIQKAEEVRDVLRSFYASIKSYDEYFYFVFITGISKFVKTGVFSLLNNLEDISMDEDYGDLLGYTKEEIEKYLAQNIENAASKLSVNKSEFFQCIESYYDGFSFDGCTRVYNPFSLMQCLKKGKISNYWYESGSPSFIVDWMYKHKIQEPESFRHKIVESTFTTDQEIERADPTSFLYQAGYLTIEKQEGESITLDYPNREVLSSISKIYLKIIYHITEFSTLGDQIWRALQDLNTKKIIEIYNIAIAGIPYEDFKEKNEFWYRSLFLMLLRGAGQIIFAEVHTNLGRSDIIIQFNKKIIVLEFKYAKSKNELKNKANEGRKQIIEKNYARPYDDNNRQVKAVVVVVIEDERKAYCEE